MRELPAFPVVRLAGPVNPFPHSLAEPAMPLASPKPQSRSKAGSQTAGDLLSHSRLPPWIVKALKANRIRRLSQLADLTDRDMLRLEGIGQRALALIRAEIARSPAGRSPSGGEAAAPGAVAP